MTVVINGSTGISGVDGTAGTPSYQGNDANTGIFFPAADTVAAAINGVEGLRLTSTGLGIGTSSPSRKLTVSGSGVFTDGTNDITIWNDGSIGTNGSVNLKFNTNGSLRATLDTSGNLGLGVTPSAWNSGARAFQIGSATYIGQQSAGSGNFGWNAYENSSSQFIYKNTNSALLFQLGNDGVYRWFTAPSGTAGNAISFTQAMTLDASGNLLLGTTSSDAPLSFKGVTSKKISLYSGSDYSIGVESSEFRIATSGATTFYTGGYTGTERARIDSSGWFKFTQGTSTAYIGDAASISGGSAGQSCLRADGSALTFAVGGSTERARIDSSGNLLVNVTSASAGKFYIRSDTSGSNTVIESQNETNGGRHISFRTNGNSEVGTITATSGGTSYNTSSDYRLKEDIQPMTGALAKVAALKPCTYKWKSDGSDGEGFIAHELAEVVPQCVTGEKDAVDADGKPVYQGIDTSFLVATLTAAIQEQQALIQSLTDRIQKLEAQ